MTGERIAELRALAAAATPGPWTVGNYEGESRNMIFAEMDTSPIIWTDTEPDEDDLAFIAASRTALPEALEAIERVRLECERALEYGDVVSSRDVAECVLAALDGTAG